MGEGQRRRRRARPSSFLPFSMLAMVGIRLTTVCVVSLLGSEGLSSLRLLTVLGPVRVGRVRVVVVLHVRRLEP